MESTSRKSSVVTVMVIDSDDDTPPPLQRAESGDTQLDVGSAEMIATASSGVAASPIKAVTSQSGIRGTMLGLLAWTEPSSHTVYYPAGEELDLPLGVLEETSGCIDIIAPHPITGDLSCTHLSGTDAVNSTCSTLPGPVRETSLAQFDPDTLLCVDAEQTGHRDGLDCTGTVEPASIMEHESYPVSESRLVVPALVSTTGPTGSSASASVVELSDCGQAAATMLHVAQLPSAIPVEQQQEQASPQSNPLPEVQSKDGAVTALPFSPSSQSIEDKSLSLHPGSPSRPDAMQVLESISPVKKSVVHSSNEVTHQAHSLDGSELPLQPGNEADLLDQQGMDVDKVVERELSSCSQTSCFSQVSVVQVFPTAPLTEDDRINSPTAGDDLTPNVASMTWVQASPSAAGEPRVASQTLGSRPNSPLVPVSHLLSVDQCPVSDETQRDAQVLTFVSPNPPVDVQSDRTIMAESSAQSLQSVTFPEVQCTVCGKTVQKPHLFSTHPLLKVPLCRRCLKKLGTCRYKKDRRGSEVYCCWCGDGGRLFCCDFCVKVFCLRCIRRNFGQKFISHLEAEDIPWKCFLCDPSLLEPLLHIAKSAVSAIESSSMQMSVDTAAPPTTALAPSATAEVSVIGAGNQSVTLTGSDNVDNNCTVLSSDRSPGAVPGLSLEMECLFGSEPSSPFMEDPFFCPLSGHELNAGVEVPTEPESLVSILGRIGQDYESMHVETNCTDVPDGDPSPHMPVQSYVKVTRRSPKGTALPPWIMLQGMLASSSIISECVVRIEPLRLNAAGRRSSVAGHSLKTEGFCEDLFGLEQPILVKSELDMYPASSPTVAMSTNDQRDPKQESVDGKMDWEPLGSEHSSSSDSLASCSSEGRTANLASASLKKLLKVKLRNRNRTSRAKGTISHPQQARKTSYSCAAITTGNSPNLPDQQPSPPVGEEQATPASPSSSSSYTVSSEVEVETDDIESYSASTNSSSIAPRGRNVRVFSSVLKSSSEYSSDSNVLTDVSVSSSEASSPVRKKPKQRRHMLSSSESNENSESDVKSSANRRRNIRKLIADKDLQQETRDAQSEEQQRLERLAQRSKLSDVDSTGEVPFILETDKKGEPLVMMDKNLSRFLKPHQRMGIQFMYDNAIESVECYKKEVKGKGKSRGCILAHCMGLGKTLQVVSLIQLLATCPEISMKTFLVLCPVNTLLNWEAEFVHWIPENSMDVYTFNAAESMSSRIRALESWSQCGGVLIIGYDMYRNLTSHKRINNRRKDTIRSTLVDPGPDLVVCDEGHLLKNDSSALSKAVSLLATKRRIILTGTPLQNNLLEYHAMVAFVKPWLLGTKKEFQNRFVRPISNGQTADATSFDVALMRKRCHVLHKLLAGFVQRKDYSCLVEHLPPKKEYVIFVRLSEKQQAMYKYYLDNFVFWDSNDPNKKGHCSLFADFGAFLLISLHAFAITIPPINGQTTADSTNESTAESTASSKELNSSEEEEEASLSTTSSSSDIVVTGSRSAPKTRSHASAMSETPPPAKDRPCTNADEFPPDLDSVWYDQFVKDEDMYDLSLGGKIVVVREILLKAVALDDKVLIFSQSLISLKLLEDFLERGLGCEDETTPWYRGRHFFRIDGRMPVALRRRQVELFSDPDSTDARVMLISTKAGGLGINLVAANRVILLDCMWNPANDQQCMFRTYRFGQIKPVYVYRLLAHGTMEEKTYERQVAKQAVSLRVVDEHQIERHFTKQDLEELYSFKAEPFDPQKVDPVPNLPEDVVLAELLSAHHPRWIIRYHEHNSLLADQDDEQLTEEERKMAWAEYETEKSMAVPSDQRFHHGIGAYSGGETSRPMNVPAVTYGQFTVPGPPGVWRASYQPEDLPLSNTADGSAHLRPTLLFHPYMARFHPVVTSAPPLHLDASPMRAGVRVSATPSSNPVQTNMGIRVQTVSHPSIRQSLHDLNQFLTRQVLYMTRPGGYPHGGATSQGAHPTPSVPSTGHSNHDGDQFMQAQLARPHQTTARQQVRVSVPAHWSYSHANSAHSGGMAAPVIISTHPAAASLRMGHSRSSSMSGPGMIPRMIGSSVRDSAPSVSVPTGVCPVQKDVRTFQSSGVPRAKSSSTSHPYLQPPRQ